MAEVLKKSSSSDKGSSVPRSQRLQQLSDKASEIRRQHLAGTLSLDEATKRIESLRKGQTSFVGALIDL